MTEQPGNPGKCKYTHTWGGGGGCIWMRWKADGRVGHLWRRGFSMKWMVVCSYGASGK